MLMRVVCNESRKKSRVNLVRSLVELHEEPYSSKTHMKPCLVIEIHCFVGTKRTIIVFFSFLFDPILFFFLKFALVVNVQSIELSFPTHHSVVVQIVFSNPLVACKTPLHALRFWVSMFVWVVWMVKGESPQ